MVALPFVGKLFSSALLTGGAEIPEGHYAADNMRQTVVPFRNAIMLSIAAGFAESAGAEGLVIAAHTGDHTIYPDCREEFMEAMGEAMRQGTYAGIRLLRPFIDLDKARIAAEGARLGVDFARTWSCYKGGAVHCGQCGTCVERREAFLEAGLPDPTVYASTGPPAAEAGGKVTPPAMLVSEIFYSIQGEGETGRHPVGLRARERLQTSAAPGATPLMPPGIRRAPSGRSTPSWPRSRAMPRPATSS